MALPLAVVRRVKLRRLATVSAAAIGSLGLPVVPLVLTASPAAAAPTVTTFSYTGASQSYVVPSGITSLTIESWGAAGDGASGGKGGYVKTTVTVTPGETLNVYVGGQGTASSGGWNGGGNRGGGAWTVPGGGGGASDVRQGGSALSNRVVVAGAGGGVAHTAGGDGGHPAGVASIDNGYNATQQGAEGGKGGTQSTGGAGGLGYCGNGAAGTLGVGGNGGYVSNYAGGGGGGGYYGGGGGGSGCFWGGAGGGGGSSFATASATGVTYLTGVRTGHGLVVITAPNRAPSTPTQDAPANGYAFAHDEAQTFRVTSTDLDGEPYTATVEVTNTGTGSVTSFTLPTTSSGSQASGAPATAFGPGNYSWRARASDGLDSSAWSGTRTFSVQQGPSGTPSVDPPNQVRTVGEQATIAVTVKDAAGNPMSASPVTISRSGANPADPQTFFTNGSGVYTYSYLGQNAGLDLVNVANGSGTTAQAAVEWVIASPTAYPSDACTGGNVASGYIGDTYLQVRQQVSGAQQWVCVVGQSSGTHLGGRVILSAAGSITPDAGVDTTQTAAESCLPIGQRVRGGTLAGGNPFYLDVAPNPEGTNGAWVCVRVASVFLRMRATADGPVTASFLPDVNTPKPYGEEAMTGLYSGTCKAAGGTRLLNLRVVDQQVALYTRETSTQKDVCVRTGPAGARLRVDANNVPGYQLGNNRDASCPWDLYDDGTIAAYTPNPLEPISLPAGVCVTVLGFTQRVTVTSAGGGLPATLDQDPT